MKVEVDAGKYTVVWDFQGGVSLHALRYGEPWRNCNGDNLTLCLAMELDDARKRIAELESRDPDQRIAELEKQIRTLALENLTLIGQQQGDY